MSFKVTAAVAAAALLSACETLDPQSGSPDPGFGEATKYNAAAQIIDPEPIYAPDDVQPGTSGVTNAAAIKRYHDDAVKELELQRTTGKRSSGSGSGSGSGGPPQ